MIARIPGFSAVTVNCSIALEESKTMNGGSNVNPFSEEISTVKRLNGLATMKSLPDLVFERSFGKIGVIVYPMSQ